MPGGESVDRARHVGQPPSTTIELASPRMVRPAGVAWLGMGLACWGWAVWTVVEAAGRPAGASERGALVIGGVLLASSLVLIGWMFTRLGVRWIGHSDARIEVFGDTLVVHHRRMLRVPVTLRRAEVSAIEALERRGFWHYSAFAPASSAALWASGAMLTTGERPNTQLRLVRDRVFPEAFWTPPAKVPLQMICCGDVTDTLFLRLNEPAGGLDALGRFMAVGQPDEDLAMQRIRGGCRSGLIRFTVISTFIVGFVTSMVGLMLSAPG